MLWLIKQHNKSVTHHYVILFRHYDLYALLVIYLPQTRRNFPKKKKFLISRNYSCLDNDSTKKQSNTRNNNFKKITLKLIEIVKNYNANYEFAEPLCSFSIYL